MKIAVIGSGISGLSAAYFLSRRYAVTLFEKNDYLGGHTRTVTAHPRDGIEIPVDTGFIVFNYRNYPLLAQLFAELDVPVHKSDMSFGLTADNGWLEYGTPKPWNIFAQKRNMARPYFWQMLGDVRKFFKKAPDYLAGGAKYTPGTTGHTLGECLDDMQVGDWFRRYFLLPMGSAIWSCPVETMLAFPAESFLRFFHNHGLLTFTDQPQWYTVTGGAKEYVSRLTERFDGTGGTIVRQGATRVARDGDAGGGDRVHVSTADGARHGFDQVVFACHADQALALIEDPTAAERDILSAFRFEKNRTVLHGDVTFMPKCRGAWCSWTYLLENRAEDRGGAEPNVTMSYWMNRLQSLDPRFPLIETLNPARAPDPALVYDTFEFDHPIFDTAAVAAQARIMDIQGSRNAWFCGAWQRNGFHEDGLWSAVRVAAALDAAPDWKL